MGLSARATRYIVGNDVMMGFSFVVAVTRFYLRIKHSQRGLWWDDFFILLSLILAVAYGAVVNVSMGHYGWDRHIWDIPVDSLSATIKSYVLAKELFILASSSIRMSLLCFYLSLVRDLGASGLRRTIYACIAANAMICTAFCLLSALECRPINAFFVVPTPVGSKCMNDGIVTTIIGGFLCLADIVVNILPLPIVAKLKIPLRRRMSIGALLSLGAVATFAGIVREYWIYRTFVATVDSTWEALPLWICTDVEIYVALLCACAPALKPLYSKVKVQKALLCFTFTRKKAGDTPDLEVGKGAKPKIAKQINVFDGSSFSNFTQVTAQDPPSSPRDKSRFSNSKRDSDEFSLAGIHVVTCIHLHESIDEEDP